MTNNIQQDKYIDNWIKAHLLRPLDSSNVPEKFRHLMPYAQTWGAWDDYVSEVLLQRATDTQLEELVKNFYPIMRHWMSGSQDPESYNKNTTREYVFFSCMRLATDGALRILKERQKKLDKN